MTSHDLADIAAEEVIDRMTAAYINAIDACAGEECPLTPKQKRYVGTSLLREAMGLRVDLERMFGNAAVLSKWTETPLADEVARWLSNQDGRLQ